MVVGGDKQAAEMVWRDEKEKEALVLRQRGWYSLQSIELKE
jgi:hypothetical protein